MARTTVLDEGGQESGVRSQESGVRSQESGVRSQEHPTGSAREDLSRNSRSGRSRGKNALYGGASEVKADKTLVRRVRAL